MKEQAPLLYRHYSESAHLTFWGTDLHIAGDPATEEQFYTTLHCLENMTTYFTLANVWPTLDAQTIAEEVTSFNQTVTEVRHGADVSKPTVTVTLEQLHALSLRRMLAAADTKSATPTDYERFVQLHAAIFLALQEEQEEERLKEESTTEPSYSDEDLPY